MDTPSFSRSEDREMGFSVGDLYRLDLDMEEQKEEKSNSLRRLIIILKK